MSTISNEMWAAIIGAVIGAIGGFFSSVGVQALWQRYTRPNIVITPEVVVRSFHLKDDKDDKRVWKYHGNRIKVSNTGRTAAENCKVFLTINGNEERISWMIREQNNTTTLNAHDSEYIDFCAIREDGGKRIATTEHGYGEYERDARPLPAGMIEAAVKVSARNAMYDEKSVTISDKAVLADEKNSAYGRIAEVKGSTLRTSRSPKGTLGGLPRSVAIATILGSVFAFFAVLTWFGVTPYPPKPDLEVDFGATPLGSFHDNEYDTTIRPGSGTIDTNFVITISNVGTEQALNVNVLLQQHPQSNSWYNFNNVRMTVGDQTSVINSNNVTLPRILKDEKVQLYYVVTLNPADYDAVIKDGMRPYIYYNVTSTNSDEKNDGFYYVKMP